MKSLDELKALRDKLKSENDVNLSGEDKIRVVVGMATCGMAAGSRPVLAALSEEVEKRQLQNVAVKQTGCIGFCQFEPIVEVFQTGREKVTYAVMTPERIARVVNDHIVNGNVVKEFVIGSYTT